MKFLAAILLVVATVHANSLHYYGWTPGKESVFRFESQVLSGIPEIRESHYAGIKLSSKVRVQSYSDYSLRIKMEETKFITLNGEIKTTESGRIIGEGGSESGKQGHLPEKFQRYLETPFLVHLKSGVVESFWVSNEEPVSVTNIKKSLLSQLQLDISGSRRSQIESNHIQLPLNEEGEVSEHNTYFTTSEEFVQGECLTTYTVHKLPEYKIKEIEENWNVEERKLKGIQFPSSQESVQETTEGKRYCEEKPYYMITRTRNFDQCKTRPVFQKWTGVEGNCDVTKSNCKSMLNHLSTTTTFVCGELNEFYVRKVVVKNIIKASPMGFNTEEKVQTTSQINMELLKVKSISERLPLPSNTKEIKSLIYAYPEQTSGLTNIPEEIIRESESILGIRPVLPQPGLTEAPKTLIPVALPKHQIISQVYEQLKKMAREVYESPESCSSKSDLAGTLSTISQYMRHLSFSELKELESKIMEESRSGYKTIEKIFYDTLSMTGTNPSVMLVIKKVEQGDLPKSMLVKMVSFTLRNVRYPTKPLLRELVKMVKSETVKSHKSLLSVSLTQLSNLFYRAYVNPTTMVTAYPTKLYGIFGTKESRVLVEEYIPYLTEQLESSSEHVRLVVISSLGKLGHMKALKPLLKVAEGKMTMEPMTRSLAVYSLKRIAKRNPTEIRPILMSLITNPVETPEVRIAAVSVLPWSKPTVTELQKIAIRSWLESSKQVSSFIRSTLKSLAYTEVPELMPSSIKAKTVLPLIKPENFGVQYSHNVNFSKFVEYLKTTVSQQFQVVNSKESLIPAKMTVSTDYYGPSSVTQLSGLSFTTYTQGMDTLLEKYLHYFTKSEETSSPIREQLQKITEELRLKTRELQSPKMYMQQSLMGIESALYLDSEIVIEALEKATQKMESSHSIEFTHVSAVELAESSNLGMTETGMPVGHTVSVPIVYAIKGFVRSEPVEGKMMPKITAKIIPVFNAKMQSAVGIISPFTEEFIGTGVEMSIHSSIPVEAHASWPLGRLGEFELTLKTPSEIERSGRETETLHGFVLPYTVRKNLHTVKPLSRSSNLKKITTGTRRQPIDMPIGQSLGLAGRLMFESDAKFVDLYSYVEKIGQTSPISFLPVVVFPSSIRESSTKIMYQPSQSETKEFHMKMKLTTRNMPHHPLSAGPINVEELENKGFSVIREVLSQLEGPSASATVIEFDASRRGHTETKTIKTAFIYGKKTHESQETIQTMSASSYKTVSGEMYNAKFEGSIEMPKLMNRWSIEKLIEEALRLRFNGKFVWGKQSGEQKEIKFETTMTKTESQKMSIKESPEYKKCMAEERKGRKLSSVCAIVRNQAASLDKVEVTIEVPKRVSNSPVVTLVGDLLRSVLIGQISEIESSESYSSSSERAVLKVEAVVDRTSEVAQVKVNTPTENLKVKNVRLLGYTKSILPLTILNRLPSLMAEKVTGYEIPSTCRVEPRFIGTFDNKTYEYKINDCEHVLLLDGSKKIPVAVLTRTVSEEKKMVKILAGTTEVKMIPESESMKIKINEETIELPRGKTVVKREHGKVIVEMKRYNDNVYMVYMPMESLTVLTDGRRVEIAAPQMLKSRSVGLCGVMNGEISTDLKTPRMCVMKPKLSAISYMLNKSGSSSSFPRCSGIPSELRPEFEHESSKCTKERVIPTPLMTLYKRIPSMNKPTVRAHIVDKQRSQTCISKQMVKICSSQSTTGGVESVEQRSGRIMTKPLAIKPKTVEFVCVPRPSSLAQTLEKRALAGEPLYVELEQYPTVYQKVEFEPVVCGQPTLESNIESRSWESEQPEIRSY